MLWSNQTCFHKCSMIANATSAVAALCRILPSTSFSNFEIHSFKSQPSSHEGTSLCFQRSSSRLFFLLLLNSLQYKNLNELSISDLVFSSRGVWGWQDWPGEKWRWEACWSCSWRASSGQPCWRARWSGGPGTCTATRQTMLRTCYCVPFRNLQYFKMKLSQVGTAAFSAHLCVTHLPWPGASGRYPGSLAPSCAPYGPCYVWCRLPFGIMKHTYIINITFIHSFPRLLLKKAPGATWDQCFFHPRI